MKLSQSISLIGFILFLQACAFGQPKETKRDTVYITQTGTKYHTKSCHYLKSSIAITLNKAVERGYLPCSVCGPPKPQTSDRNADNSVVQTTPAQPPVSPSRTSTTETQARQCMANTKSGLRCKRNTTNSSGKCWQHE